MRKDQRGEQELRFTAFEPGYTKYPEGSCFVRMGETWVLCTATIEEKVPPFLDGKNEGWVTAEYSMLPRATHNRTRRDSTTGKVNGRSQEIQRLIGRALRSCMDMKALGQRSILIDCDVIQADGGTRIASINGAFIALALAVAKLQRKGTIATSPIKSAVAGVSVGLKNGKLLVDLDYNEDSNADVDMNVVMLEGGKMVEIQGTAERSPFTREESQKMLDAAGVAIEEMIGLQRATLEKCLSHA